MRARVRAKQSGYTRPITPERPRPERNTVAMSQTPAPTKNTQAFFFQAAASFGIALLGFIWAMLYMPLGAWERGFLCMTGLFLISSCFTLAKVIRDAQDDKYVVSRLDQARVDKILAEHDPYRTVA